MSSFEIEVECNQELKFEVGSRRECHNYTIAQDEMCELEENTTLVELRLGLSSTTGLNINSSLSNATVVIDDQMEPECCEAVLCIKNHFF